MSVIMVNNLAALIILLISIPLIFNKIKPNRIYGFRTSRTKSDPEVWYKVNQLMGKHLGLSMALFLLLSLILKLTNASSIYMFDLYHTMALGLFVIVPIITTISFYMKIT